MRSAVLGATGFIGTACSLALGAISATRPVTAPRRRTSSRNVASIVGELERHRDVIDRLAEELRGVDVVVTAAGLAQPSAPDSAESSGANSLLPVVVAAASADAGAHRMIQISSSAV